MQWERNYKKEVFCSDVDAPSTGCNNLRALGSKESSVILEFHIHSLNKHLFRGPGCTVLLLTSRSSQQTNCRTADVSTEGRVQSVGRWNDWALHHELGQGAKGIRRGDSLCKDTKRTA